MSMMRKNKQYEIFEVDCGNMQDNMGCLRKRSTSGTAKNQGWRGTKT